MLKKAIKLIFCMFLIEISSFSLLLSYFAFIDIRDNSRVYHTVLMSELLKDHQFLLSLLLAIVFAISSWISLRKYSEQIEEDGVFLHWKHKRAIILVSVLLPPLVLAVMMLVSAFIAPIQKIWLKVLFWSGDLIFFILVNLVSSSKLLRWFEKGRKVSEIDISTII